MSSYDGNEGVDLLVEIILQHDARKASHFYLAVEAKANGQPRWARTAASVLKSRLEAFAGAHRQVYGVFVAPYVSEAGAEVLRDRGMGYLDLAGNCRLAFDCIYIERTGNPNPFTEKSELRTLFSPKASRVLRVLLFEPYRPWRLNALADEADVSLGLVAKVKPLLLDRDWAVETPDGLNLTDPESALDTWADNFRRKSTQVHDFYSFGNPRETEERVAAAAEAAGVRYALAEFSGAERVAPHVRYNRSAVYVESKALGEIAERADLRPVETGPNIRLFEPYDEGVFFKSERVGPVVVAHPIQLYLDLKKARARGEEAADFLRRLVLEKRWNESLGPAAENRE